MYHRILFGLALACLLLKSWATSAADDPSIVRHEFIYETAAYPECHASTIEETPAGMVAAWFGGTEEKHPDVGIWVSRHLNGAWTPSVEVANGIQYTLTDGKPHRHPTWNPVLLQYPEGPLFLFWKCGPAPDNWWGMMSESTDHGETWSLARRLPEHIDGPHALGLLRIDRPDLMLLDYEVRGLNGLETLHRIQAQHSGRLPVPVILFVAENSPEIKAEAEALGVYKVLILPYSPIELLDKYWNPVRNFLVVNVQSPSQWPLVIAHAAQSVIVMAKATIDPALAAKIVMESAIPMAKVSPARIHFAYFESY